MKTSRRLSDFQLSFLVSLGLHAALALLMWQGGDFFKALDASRDRTEIEIDLTRPFRLTSDPSLARRAQVSGTGAPAVNSPKPGGAPQKTPVVSPVQTPEPGPTAPPKDWTLPSPDTKETEKPAPDAGASGAAGDSPGTGPGLGGLGEGTGGEVDWVHLTKLPAILNRDRLAEALRKFYPPEERAAGREGTVVVDVHLGPDGLVRGVDVAETGGAAFDEAARKAVGVARFSPAMVGKKPVAVKIRLPVDFRLYEQ